MQVLGELGRQRQLIVDRALARDDSRVGSGQIVGHLVLWDVRRHVHAVAEPFSRARVMSWKMSLFGFFGWFATITRWTSGMSGSASMAVSARVGRGCSPE